MTALQSRTIWIGTHRTGVRLHPSMWDAFEIAERQGKTVHDVLFEIDPRSIEIRIDGAPLPALPDADLPLNRRYFLM